MRPVSVGYPGRTMTEKKPAPASSPSDPGARDHPGQRLGRPERGPGSVARIPRRLLAFVLDWYLCYGLCLILLGPMEGWRSLMAVVAFLVYQAVLVGAMGHTLGQWVCGMQVQTLGGQPVGFRRAAVRALLVTLVVPVVLMDQDQRGLQDQANGSVLVRIR